MHRRRAAKRPHSRITRILAIERLEERCLLTTFNVTNKDDAGAGSLREAIEDANSSGGADKILFDASLSGKTIKINDSLPEITDSLKVLNKNSKNVTVDGQDAAGVRPFNIAAAATVTLKKLTITGGNVHGTIDGSDDGGGVVNQGGELTLQQSIVTGNRTTVDGEDGGGIANVDGGTLNVKDSVVSNNGSIGQGGGIRNEQGTLLVVNSQVRGNRDQGFGGGISSVGSASLVTVRDSTVSANVSGFDGGGFAIAESTLIVERSTISGNRAAASGGGIFITSGGTVELRNATLAHNITDEGVGGGVCQDAGTLTIESCTIAVNADTSTPVTAAGGIAKISGALIVRNTIVAGNFAGPNSSDDNIGQSVFDENTDNFIGGDPLLGPLANHGGPTNTMATMDGSPVIDAGDNTAAIATGLTTDQRGLTRIVNGTVDIGAFETQTDEPLPLQLPQNRRDSRDQRAASLAGAFDIDLAFAAAVLNQNQSSKRYAAARFAMFAQY